MASRPNIILITAEDLGPRWGAFGDPVAVTPNLDAFAAEAVRFDRAFTTAGVCAPSRSALITGVHQQTLGTMHMRTTSFGKDMPFGEPYVAVPPSEIKAFPELLRRAGYYTINRAKTDYQFGEPFTIWDQNSNAATWKGRKPGQPFFAMINFAETHESKLWPPETQGSHPSIPSVLQQNRQLDAAKTFARTKPSDVEVPPYFPDTPTVRANLARHYDNVRLLDINIGRLLNELRREGRFEDSIIIVTTDHGDGLPRAKRTLYDSGLRVPLMVRFPDRSRGGTVDHRLVSFVDIAPTILRMAGAKPPSWIQGQDFLSGPPRRYVHAAADRFDEVTQRRKSVRDERYLYIRNYITDQPPLPSLLYQNVNPIMAEWRRLDSSGSLSDQQSYWLRGPLPEEELYDVVADPHQVRNLSSDIKLRPVLGRMRSELSRWISRTGDLSAIDERALVRLMGALPQPKTAPVSACRKGNGLRLASASDGASIGWAGEDGEWKLYVAPIEPTSAVRVRAVRYGWSDSDVRVIDPASVPRC